MFASYNDCPLGLKKTPSLHYIQFSKRCASRGELILSYPGLKKTKGGRERRNYTYTQDRLYLLSYSLSFKSLSYVRIILNRTLPLSEIFVVFAVCLLTPFPCNMTATPVFAFLFSLYHLQCGSSLFRETTEKKNCLVCSEGG